MGVFRYILYILKPIELCIPKHVGGNRDVTVHSNTQTVTRV